ncbi:DNA topoisomerase, partial [candidate division KSB1 bacterium]
MKKSLVIVESPSKAKTINKFLGDAFTVKATVGHIKNLPEDKLGVNIEDGYIPDYVTIPKQRKVIGELKKEAEAAQDIFIATDPDREGEAIAWHIANTIGVKNKNIHRALFNEITKNAVMQAIENPLAIDNDKVDAQQARRVMDRLVGYKVSPILWRALYKGSLSAGRVQSVALKLICVREVEIRNFVKEEYWSIHIDLETPDEKVLRARLSKINGKKPEINDKAGADSIIADFEKEPFVVKNVEKKNVKRRPLAPFITSTLQQEASTRLGFSPTKTMTLSQQLYEGI